MSAVFASAGHALYGARWRAQAATAYGCSYRAMVNYSTGLRPVPAPLWAWLSEQLAARRDEAAALSVACAERIGRAASPAGEHPRQPPPSAPAT